MSKKLSADQKLFNVVVGYLRRQGCKSEDGGNCLYRGVNGRRCAAGCVIPNDFYNPEMEGKVIGTLLDENLSLRGHITNRFGGLNYALLEDLQKIHDGSKVSSWEKGFESVAREFNLKVPRRGAKQR